MSNIVNWNQQTNKCQMSETTLRIAGKYNIICGSFNDAVSSSDCITSSDGMINEL
jgi:hypothetical protein